MVILSNYTKPNISALSQPFRMAAHALDWGDSLNPRHRGDKRLTMVVMFVGCLVLDDNPNIILFLPYKTYGVGNLVELLRTLVNSASTAPSISLLPKMAGFVTFSTDC
jgi:hypothetical protein